MSSRSVPFVDVPAMMRVHGEKLEIALAEVVRSGMFINGPRVEELESRLAARTGVDHAVACGSGTAAQQIVLMALGIGPGDEVLVPDFTFIASAEAVAAVGAKLVMVDVDPHTFTMDPAPPVLNMAGFACFIACHAARTLTEIICSKASLLLFSKRVYWPKMPALLTRPSRRP